MTAKKTSEKKGFMYAVPGESVTAETIEEIGLGPVLTGRNPSQQQYYEGPGETRGIYLSTTGLIRGKNLTWVQAQNGKYFVGYDPENLPGEEDLKRETQLAGHGIEMGNGELWLIPVARKFAEGSVLPTALMIGKDGELIQEPLAEYAEFSKKVERYWDDFNLMRDGREDEIKMKYVEWIELIIDAVKWNYYISVEEVNILRLINTRCVAPALSAIIDVPGVIAMETAIADAKKNGSPVKTENS